MTLCDTVVIPPNHLSKQSRQNKHLEMMVFKAYTEDDRLCIDKTLTEYVDRTRGLRNSEKLLISMMKPHKAVSKSTVSGWVKMVLLKALWAAQH